MDPNHPFHNAPNKGPSYPSQPPHPTQPQRAPPQSQYPASYGHGASSGGGAPNQWGYSASSTPQVSNAPSHMKGVTHQTGPVPHGAPQSLPSAAPTANSNYYGSTRGGWEAQRQHEQQNQQQQQQPWQQQQWQQQQQQQLEQQQRQQPQQQWQHQQRQQLEQQRHQPQQYHPTSTMGPQAPVPPGNSNWGNTTGGSLSVGSPGVAHRPQGPPNPPVGGRVRCPRCGTTYPSGRACPSCGYR